MSGFFKIDRAIFDSDIWQSPAELRLFLFLIGRARYQDEPIVCDGVTIKRGQFLRSYRKLQEDLGYTENRAVKKYPRTSLRRLVKNLIKTDRITVEETPAGTLFTVVNYAKYQDPKPKEGAKHLDQDSLIEKTQEETAVLEVLKSIPNWTFDEGRDLSKIRELASEFPRVDMLRAVKEMRDWLEDNPLKKSSNQRLRLRRWITKADEIGTHRRNTVVDAENWLRR